jgi:hypothetical protein
MVSIKSDSNIWKNVVARLSEIREQDDYSASNISYVQEHLLSSDDRIRAAATLASEGCVIESAILNIIIDLAENDEVFAIRRAAIQVVHHIIYQGLIERLEDDIGSSTELDYYQEWDEIQSELLRDDYQRVKSMLLTLVENEFEELEIRETALISLSDLGFLEIVREWILEFLESEYPSSQLAALKAIGKYPHFWISHIEKFLDPSTSKPLLLEAISSSYSSESEKLAKKIVPLLEMEDPEILQFAILSLGNLNKTENIAEILQRFSLHADQNVQKAAREAIENFSKQSFSKYLHDELGMDE